MKIKSIIKYAILLLGGFTMIVPFAWMLSTSFKTKGATMIMPPEFIPAEPSFDNFIEVFTKFPMMTFMKNSILVAVLTTIGTIVMASMAAYAFARMKFKGRNIIFLMFLATMMIPSQVTMIPQFILLKNLGWVNTYQGLILPNIFGAFGIFQMRK